MHELIYGFQDCGESRGSAYWPHREREKKGSQKSGGTSASQSAGVPGNSLAAFQERLRNLCQDDSACHGQNREDRIHAQTQHALALAGELGCLRESVVSWEEFLALCPDATCGTEHMVELDALAGKTTIPPGF